MLRATMGPITDTLGKMDFRVRETNSVSLSKVKVKKTKQTICYTKLQPLPAQHKSYQSNTPNN